MAVIINDLITFFGLEASPATFADFISWFLTVCIGLELVRFVFIAIFSLISAVGRGIEKGGK